MSTAIVWFRQDLRVADNLVLQKALNAHEQVLPVFIVDEACHMGNTAYGFPKYGTYKKRFLAETIADLQSKLQNLRVDLELMTGNTASCLAKVVEESGASAIYCQELPTHEEQQQVQAIEHACTVPVHSIWQSTLFAPDDLPFSIDKIPDVFTQFRKKCEKYAAIRETVAAPEKLVAPTDWKFTQEDSAWRWLQSADNEAIDERSAFPFKGGETAAWDRLNDYFYRHHHLKNYKYTRNGLLGTDYSSKFSAWLAMGCISPIQIYHEVQRYEKSHHKNVSTYWLIFELIWRDYFYYVAAKYGERLFYSGGIKYGRYNWKKDDALFEKWRTGQTGVPFVDANMRELMQTGFMSNRGRQNVASFLTKDLEIDWRWGAEWFESQLVDHDVCANYGNWNYVAGIGNDPREDRYFNVVTQANRYDAKAQYIKTWIPELRDAMPEDAIAPWMASIDLFGTDPDYPHPIVEGKFM